MSTRGAPFRGMTFGAALAVTACSAAAIQPAPPMGPITLAEFSPIESVEPYRAAGFLVGDGDVPFVGMVRYAGSETLDSTMMLVAISIPPRTLSFVRAGDRYAAYYAVKIDVLSGQTLVRSERPVGEVRVASFQETTRGDEGVIFQRTLRVAPGNYTLRVTAQDSLGAGTSTSTTPLTVPVMASGVLAPMIPVFAADLRTARSAPLTLVVNPRSTARYGRDSVFQVYLEAYGNEAPDTIVLTTTREVDRAAVLRRDTVVFPRGRDVRSSLTSIPVARLGLGAIRVSASRPNGMTFGSIQTIITIGTDLPLASVDELLDALKYFASESDLRTIRLATPERRAVLWAALVRQSDPNSSTPDNEALVEYFRRLRVANALYRDGAVPGWQTDRGSVVAALGEPDAMTDPQPSDSVGSARLTTWEYRRHRLLLVFSDQAGFGRWRLTLASEADFRTILSLAGPCVGCR